VKKASFLFVAFVLALPVAGPHAQQPLPAVTLLPTNHPRLPSDVSQLWMAPEPGRARTTAQNEFTMAVKLEVDGNFAKALPYFSQPALRQGPLAEYAEYYAGLAKLRLGRLDEARRAFQMLAAKPLIGYLVQAVGFREAECNEAMNDYAGALAVYERLAKAKTIATEEVLMRLARAAKLAGNSEKALQTYARVYYEYPLSDQALSAGAELANGSQPGAPSRFKLGLQRAERLFVAKRYAQARSEFDALRPQAQGDDRELVDLRVAECDYFLKRARNAKTALRPFIDRASRQGEALFFYAVSLRELNEIDEYLQVIDRLTSDFPTQTWADDGLSDLGTHYILTDDDEKADQVFRELYRRFPTGHNAERAAWKVGWWAYKKGNYADTARVFEHAASDFPRSDYRPMWLYWSGRAYDGLKESELALSRYILAVTDYGNSYYGRLAAKRLEERGARPPERRLVLDVKGPAAGGEQTSETPQVAPVPLPPTVAVIRAFLAIDLYDQAIDELHYAQKAWGDSSAIEATLAWTLWQQGRVEKGMEQFSLYRGAINAMKRAYPHYLAAGGEQLPDQLLKIIFPVSYWDAIRKYAALYDLDPYVAAALISQESTFVPDVRSYANAWGLTQLLPSTAKQYARIVKLRYTPKLLTDPDANLRMGLAYFRDKIKEFGSVPLALASYNAGERPVYRWMMERQGLPEDEFIDDIPYPQTNNYVKKIMGTAEDYRRLYSSEPPKPEGAVASASGAPKAVDEATAKVASAGAGAKKTVKRTPPAVNRTKSTVKKKRTRKIA
jgi:soluble lytic murein transglycosylase